MMSDSICAEYVYVVAEVRCTMNSPVIEESLKIFWSCAGISMI
jgi:hypothetical protein